MASIIIPVIPIVIGVIGGIIAKYLLHPATLKLSAPYALWIPLPVIIAGVVGALVVHHLSSPAPVSYTSSEPYGVSPVVTSIVSAVIQFVIQVLWPLIQQYL